MNSKVEIIPQGKEVVVPEQSSILDRAFATGNIEIIERSLTLHERIEARAEHKAYNRAIARAKAEFPAIIKNRSASFGVGKTSYKYEDLAQVTQAVDPALSKHGLHYRWRTENPPGGLITVTCIVSHDDGHSEENSLSAGADTTGSKNAVQAIVSTQTYLQRATLKAALGLAAGQDDDGRASGEPVTINEAQLEEIQKLIVEVAADIPLFCKYFKLAEDRIEALPAKEFDRAKVMLKAKRGKK